MSWLFPRLLKWNDNILNDAESGQILAMVASFSHDKTGTRVWAVLPWEGYWKEDLSVVYASRDEAVLAAEKTYK